MFRSRFVRFSQPSSVGVAAVTANINFFSAKDPSGSPISIPSNDSSRRFCSNGGPIRSDDVKRLDAITAALDEMSEGLELRNKTLKKYMNQIHNLFMLFFIGVGVLVGDTLMKSLR